VKDGELIKLLGVPFGLNLDTKEVDAFLIEKLQKKLRQLEHFSFASCW
jgi:hypothetical protein